MKLENVSEQKEIFTKLFYITNDEILRNQTTSLSLKNTNIDNNSLIPYFVKINTS